MVPTSGSRGTLYFSTQHLQFDTVVMEGDDDDDDDDDEGATWTLIIANSIGASNGSQV